MQPMFDRIISNKLTKTFTNRFKGSRFLCSVNDLAVAFPQNMITLESDTKTFEVNQICVDKTKFFGRGLHQVYAPALRAVINSIPKWVAFLHHPRNLKMSNV